MAIKLSDLERARIEDTRGPARESMPARSVQGAGGVGPRSAPPGIVGVPAPQAAPPPTGVGMSPEEAERRNRNVMVQLQGDGTAVGPDGQAFRAVPVTPEGEVIEGPLPENQEVMLAIEDDGAVRMMPGIHYGNGNVELQFGGASVGAGSPFGFAKQFTGSAASLTGGIMNFIANLAGADAQPGDPIRDWGQEYIAEGRAEHPVRAQADIANRAQTPAALGSMVAEGAGSFAPMAWMSAGLQAAGAAPRVAAGASGGLAVGSEGYEEVRRALGGNAADVGPTAGVLSAAVGAATDARLGRRMAHFAPTARKEGVNEFLQQIGVTGDVAAHAGGIEEGAGREILMAGAAGYGMGGVMGQARKPPLALVKLARKTMAKYRSDKAAVDAAGQEAGLGDEFDEDKAQKLEQDAIKHWAEAAEAFEAAHLKSLAYSDDEIDGMTEQEFDAAFGEKAGAGLDLADRKSILKQYKRDKQEYDAEQAAEQAQAQQDDAEPTSKRFSDLERKDRKPDPEVKPRSDWTRSAQADQVIPEDSDGPVVPDAPPAPEPAAAKDGAVEVEGEEVAPPDSEVVGPYDSARAEYTKHMSPKGEKALSEYDKAEPDEVRAVEITRLAQMLRSNPELIDEGLEGILDDDFWAKRGEPNKDSGSLHDLGERLAAHFGNAAWKRVSPSILRSRGPAPLDMLAEMVGKMAEAYEIARSEALDTTDYNNRSRDGKRIAALEARLRVTTADLVGHAVMRLMRQGKDEDSALIPDLALRDVGSGAEMANQLHGALREHFPQAMKVAEAVRMPGEAKGQIARDTIEVMAQWAANRHRLKENAIFAGREKRSGLGVRARDPVRRDGREPMLVPPRQDIASRDDRYGLFGAGAGKFGNSAGLLLAHVSADKEGKLKFEAPKSEQLTGRQKKYLESKGYAKDGEWTDAGKAAMAAAHALARKPGFLEGQDVSDRGKFMAALRNPKNWQDAGLDGKLAALFEGDAAADVLFRMNAAYHALDRSNRHWSFAQPPAEQTEADKAGESEMPLPEGEKKGKKPKGKPKAEGKPESEREERIRKHKKEVAEREAAARATPITREEDGMRENPRPIFMVSHADRKDPETGKTVNAMIFYHNKTQTDGVVYEVSDDVAKDLSSAFFGVVVATLGNFMSFESKDGVVTDYRIWDEYRTEYSSLKSEKTATKSGHKFTQMVLRSSETHFDSVDVSDELYERTKDGITFDPPIRIDLAMRNKVAYDFRPHKRVPQPTEEEEAKERPKPEPKPEPAPEAKPAEAKAKPVADKDAVENLEEDVGIDMFGSGSQMEAFTGPFVKDIGNPDPGEVGKMDAAGLGAFISEMMRAAEKEGISLPEHYADVYGRMQSEPINKVLAESYSPVWLALGSTAKDGPGAVKRLQEATDLLQDILSGLRDNKAQLEAGVFSQDAQTDLEKDVESGQRGLAMMNAAAVSLAVNMVINMNVNEKGESVAPVISSEQVEGVSVFDVASAVRFELSKAFPSVANEWPAVAAELKVPLEDVTHVRNLSYWAWERLRTRQKLDTARAPWTTPDKKPEVKEPETKSKPKAKPGKKPPKQGTIPLPPPKKEPKKPEAKPAEAPPTPEPPKAGDGDQPVVHIPYEHYSSSRLRVNERVKSGIVHMSIGPQDVFDIVHDAGLPGKNGKVEIDSKFPGDSAYRNSQNSWPPGTNINNDTARARQVKKMIMTGLRTDKIMEERSTRLTAKGRMVAAIAVAMKANEGKGAAAKALAKQPFTEKNLLELVKSDDTFFDDVAASREKIISPAMANQIEAAVRFAYTFGFVLSSGIKVESPFLDKSAGRKESKPDEQEDDAAQPDEAKTEEPAGESAPEEIAPVILRKGARKHLIRTTTWFLGHHIDDGHQFRVEIPTTMVMDMIRRTNKIFGNKKYQFRFDDLFPDDSMLSEIRVVKEVHFGKEKIPVPDSERKEIIKKAVIHGLKENERVIERIRPDMMEFTARGEMISNFLAALSLGEGKGSAVRALAGKVINRKALAQIIAYDEDFFSDFEKEAGEKLDPMWRRLRLPADGAARRIWERDYIQLSGIPYVHEGEEQVMADGKRHVPAVEPESAPAPKPEPEQVPAQVEKSQPQQADAPPAVDAAPEEEKGSEAGISPHPDLDDLNFSPEIAFPLVVGDVIKWTELPREKDSKGSASDAAVREVIASVKEITVNVLPSGTVLSGAAMNVLRSSGHDSLAAGKSIVRYDTGLEFSQAVRASWRDEEARKKELARQETSIAEDKAKQKTAHKKKKEAESAAEKPLPVPNPKERPKQKSRGTAASGKPAPKPVAKPGQLSIKVVEPAIARAIEFAEGMSHEDIGLASDSTSMAATIEALNEREEYVVLDKAHAGNLLSFLQWLSEDPSVPGKGEIEAQINAIREEVGLSEDDSSRRPATSEMSGPSDKPSRRLKPKRMKTRQQGIAGMWKPPERLPTEKKDEIEPESQQGVAAEEGLPESSDEAILSDRKAVIAERQRLLKGLARKPSGDEVDDILFRHEAGLGLRGIPLRALRAAKDWADEAMAKMEAGEPLTWGRKPELVVLRRAALAQVVAGRIVMQAGGFSDRSTGPESLEQAVRIAAEFDEKAGVPKSLPEEWKNFSISFAAAVISAYVTGKSPAITRNTGGVAEPFLDLVVAGVQAPELTSDKNLAMREALVGATSISASIGTVAFDAQKNETIEELKASDLPITSAVVNFADKQSLDQEMIDYARSLFKPLSSVYKAVFILDGAVSAEELVRQLEIDWPAYIDEDKRFGLIASFKSGPESDIWTPGIPGTKIAVIGNIFRPNQFPHDAGFGNETAVGHPREASFELSALWGKWNPGLEQLDLDMRHFVEFADRRARDSGTEALGGEKAVKDQFEQYLLEKSGKPGDWVFNAKFDDVMVLKNRIDNVIKEAKSRTIIKEDEHEYTYHVGRGLGIVADLERGRIPAYKYRLGFPADGIVDHVIDWLVETRDGLHRSVPESMPRSRAYAGQIARLMPSREDLLAMLKEDIDRYSNGGIELAGLLARHGPQADEFERMFNAMEKYGGSPSFAFALRLGAKTDAAATAIQSAHMALYSLAPAYLNLKNRMGVVSWEELKKEIGTEEVVFSFAQLLSMSLMNTLDPRNPQPAMNARGTSEAQRDRNVQIMNWLQLYGQDKNRQDAMDDDVRAAHMAFFDFWNMGETGYSDTMHTVHDHIRKSVRQGLLRHLGEHENFDVSKRRPGEGFTVSTGGIDKMKRSIYAMSLDSIETVFDPAQIINYIEMLGVAPLGRKLDPDDTSIEMRDFFNSFSLQPAPIAAALNVDADHAGNNRARLYDLAEVQAQSQDSAGESFSKALATFGAISSFRIRARQKIVTEALADFAGRDTSSMSPPEMDSVLIDIIAKKFAEFIGYPHEYKSWNDAAVAISSSLIKKATDASFEKLVKAGTAYTKHNKAFISDFDMGRVQKFQKYLWKKDDLTGALNSWADWAFPNSGLARRDPRNLDYGSGGYFLHEMPFDYGPIPNMADEFFVKGESSLRQVADRLDEYLASRNFAVKPSRFLTYHENEYRFDAAAVKLSGEEFIKMKARIVQSLQLLERALGKELGGVGDRFGPYGTMDKPGTHVSSGEFKDGHRDLQPTLIQIMNADSGRPVASFAITNTVMLSHRMIGPALAHELAHMFSAMMGKEGYGKWFRALMAGLAWRMDPQTIYRAAMEYAGTIAARSPEEGLNSLNLAADIFKGFKEKGATEMAALYNIHLKSTEYYRLSALLDNVRESLDHYPVVSGSIERMGMKDFDPAAEAYSKGKKSGRYISQLEEMFARLFDWAVSEKISAMGAADSLLSDVAGLVSAQGIYPSPKSRIGNTYRNYQVAPPLEERDYFMGLFDRFMENIEWTKDGLVLKDESMDPSYIVFGDLNFNDIDAWLGGLKGLMETMGAMPGDIAGKVGDLGRRGEVSRINPRADVVVPEASDPGMLIEHKDPAGAGGVGVGDLKDYNPHPVDQTYKVFTSTNENINEASRFAHQLRTEKGVKTEHKISRLQLAVAKLARDGLDQGERWIAGYDLPHIDPPNNLTKDLYDQIYSNQTLHFKEAQKQARFNMDLSEVQERINFPMLPFEEKYESSAFGGAFTDQPLANRNSHGFHSEVSAFLYPLSPSVLIAAGTGFGKTITAQQIIMDHRFSKPAGNHQTAFFFTPKPGLVNQYGRDADKIGRATMPNIVRMAIRQADIEGATVQDAIQATADHYGVAEPDIKDSLEWAVGKSYGIRSSISSNEKVMNVLDPNTWMAHHENDLERLKESDPEEWRKRRKALNADKRRIQAILAQGQFRHRRENEISNAAAFSMVLSTGKHKNIARKDIIFVSPSDGEIDTSVRRELIVSYTQAKTETTASFLAPSLAKFDGMAVFDESHEFKNSVLESRGARLSDLVEAPTKKENRPSDEELLKVGPALRIDISKDKSALNAAFMLGAPNARIVYMSATPVDDITTSGYLMRVIPFGYSLSSKSLEGGFLSKLDMLKNAGTMARPDDVGKLIQQSIQRYRRGVALEPKREEGPVRIEEADVRPEVSDQINALLRMLVDSSNEWFEIYHGELYRLLGDPSPKSLVTIEIPGGKKVGAVSNVKVYKKFAGNWNSQIQGELLRVQRYLNLAAKTPTLLKLSEDIIGEGGKVFLEIALTQDAALSKAEHPNIFTPVMSILDNVFDTYSIPMVSNGRMVAETEQDAKNILDNLVMVQSTVLQSKKDEIRAKLLDHMKALSDIEMEPLLGALVNKFGVQAVSTTMSMTHYYTRKPGSIDLERHKLPPSMRELDRHRFQEGMRTDKGPVLKTGSLEEKAKYSNVARILVVSADSGGVGLDFHDTDHYPRTQLKAEGTNSPSNSMQVDGRVGRPGQYSVPKRIVVINKSNMIEERLAIDMADKIKTLDAAVTGDERGSQAVSSKSADWVSLPTGEKGDWVVREVMRNLPKIFASKTGGGSIARTKFGVRFGGEELAKALLTSNPVMIAGGQTDIFSVSTFTDSIVLYNRLGYLPKDMKDFMIRLISSASEYADFFMKRDKGESDVGEISSAKSLDEITLGDGFDMDVVEVESVRRTLSWEEMEHVFNPMKNYALRRPNGSVSLFSQESLFGTEWSVGTGDDRVRQYVEINETGARKLNYLHTGAFKQTGVAINEDEASDFVKPYVWLVGSLANMVNPVTFVGLGENATPYMKSYAEKPDQPQASRRKYSLLELDQTSNLFNLKDLSILVPATVFIEGATRYERIESPEIETVDGPGYNDDNYQYFRNIISHTRAGISADIAELDKAYSMFAYMMDTYVEEAGLPEHYNKNDFDNPKMRDVARAVDEMTEGYSGDMDPLSGQFMFKSDFLQKATHKLSIAAANAAAEFSRFYKAAAEFKDKYGMISEIPSNVADTEAIWNIVQRLFLHRDPKRRDKKTLNAYNRSLDELRMLFMHKSLLLSGRNYNKSGRGIIDSILAGGSIVPKSERKPASKKENQKAYNFILSESYQSSGKSWGASVAEPVNDLYSIVRMILGLRVDQMRPQGGAPTYRSDYDKARMAAERAGHPKSPLGNRAERALSKPGTARYRDRRSQVRREAIDIFGLALHDHLLAPSFSERNLDHISAALEKYAEAMAKMMANFDKIVVESWLSEPKGHSAPATVFYGKQEVDSAHGRYQQPIGYIKTQYSQTAAEIIDSASVEILNAFNRGSTELLINEKDIRQAWEESQKKFSGDMHTLFPVVSSRTGSMKVLGDIKSSLLAQGPGYKEEQREYNALKSGNYKLDTVIFLGQDKTFKEGFIIPSAMLGEQVSGLKPFVSRPHATDARTILRGMLQSPASIMQLNNGVIVGHARTLSGYGVGAKKPDSHLGQDFIEQAAEEFFAYFPYALPLVESKRMGLVFESGMIKALRQGKGGISAYRFRDFISLVNLVNESGLMTPQPALETMADILEIERPEDPEGQIEAANKAGYYDIDGEDGEEGIPDEDEHPFRGEQ